MSFHIDRIVLLSAAAICVACTDVAAQLASGSFERVLEVDAPVTLEVVTGSGSVDIRPGTSDEVQIAGRISVSRGFGRSTAEAEELVRRLESEPPIETSGDLISVGRIDDPDLQRNVSISYDILVPADTSATIRSGSGDQRVSGLRGDLEIVAGSGDVELESIEGGVNARTGSGSINGSGMGGDFVGQTGSGSISLVKSGTGSVDVSTGSGDSTLRGIDGALRARAGSGDIEAEGIQREQWNLETGSGDVRVRLPADAGFEVNARVGSGDIETDYSVTSGGRVDRRGLTGQVNDGGPLLQLRTGSGDIRIEQQ